MKKYYLLLMIMNVVFSQDSVFTIQSFKPENIKEGLISLRLSNYFRNSSNEYNRLSEPREESDNSSIANSLNTSMDWDYKYESKKIFLYSNFSPSIRYSKNSYDDDSNSAFEKSGETLQLLSNTNGERNYMDLRFDYEFIGSRYFFKTLGIMGVSDLSISTNYDDEYRLNEGVKLYEMEYGYPRNEMIEYSQRINYENKMNRIGVSGKIGPIYGRIYEGLYAAKSLEIISELRALGQLKKEPSKAEMSELSRFIYEEMNRYHYDTRIKRIESLKRITSWLIEVDPIV